MEPVAVLGYGGMFPSHFLPKKDPSMGWAMRQDMIHSTVAEPGVPQGSLLNLM